VDVSERALPVPYFFTSSSLPLLSTCQVQLLAVLGIEPPGLIHGPHRALYVSSLPSFSRDFFFQ